MNRAVSSILLIAFIVVAFISSPGAQTPPQNPPPSSQPGQSSGQITGVISGVGLSRLALAIPAFKLAAIAPGPVRDASSEIHATVVSDLQFTGYFDVLPEERYGSIPDEPSRLPFQQWAATGAVALLVGSVSPEAERLALEGLLFDTRGEQLILGKRYRGDAGVARQIGHRLANEIVLHFTGRPGIALTRLAFEGRMGKAKEIFMMDYDGKGLKQVTRNGSLNLTPSISPDGSRIAFISYKSGRPKLYVLSQDGSMAEAAPTGTDLCAAPDWSPDGRSIAFSAAKKGDSDIYIYDTTSNSIRQVNTSPGSDTSPTWSPSGNEIAFTSDRTGRPQVYVMDTRGGNVRRLTFEGSYNDQPAWAPQGDRIAYAGWVGDHFDIFVIDVASGAAKRLTGGAGYNENPRWSPDGRHLVFVSNRVGLYQVHTMDDNGERPQRLATPFDAFGADWSRQ